MCCGDKRAALTGNGTADATAIKMLYRGNGSAQIRGRVTGQIYQFPRQQPVQAVDPPGRRISGSHSLVHPGTVNVASRTRLRELVEAESELVSFAMRQQVVPCDFAPLIAGHAAKHATQRRLHARADLVVCRPGCDALDEAAILVAIGVLQIIKKRAVGGEFTGPRNARGRLLPFPRLGAGDLDRARIRHCR